MTQNAKKRFVVYDLREMYHEVGDYEFKVVLDPKYFRNGHLTTLDARDSDGKPMKVAMETWGRKVRCAFKIDQDVADGVSVFKLELRDDTGARQSARLTCWVVK